MSRAIFGLVALLLLAPSLAFTQATGTVVIQSPDGGTTFTGIVQGGVPVPAPGGQAPARDTAQPPKVGTSVIRGRAVAADSGQPLRRATVRLMSPTLAEPRSTATDGEGRYEFRDLPAGRYTLTTMKNGYVMMNYGARAWNQPGRVIDLADKQQADRVDFSLSRGGVITGRVLDEFGDPVVGANIQPLRSDVINGERRATPAGSMVTTSDTGEFRLWGLSPADYQVMANPQRAMNFGPDVSDDRTGYAASYYPGTTNPAEALNIKVAAGQITTGIDIILSPTRTATISGSAIDANGQPLRRGNVMLMPRNPGGMFMGPQAGGMIRADGTFSISNVAPGEYTVRATIMPSAPGLAPEQLTANVSVAGADVTGVILTPVRPIRVTGRITLDPPGAWVDAAALRVMAQPRNPTPMFFGAGMTPPVTKDDFTFELGTGAGVVLLRAFPNSPGPGATPWTVKSVRYDGKEIIDSGLELSDGRDVDGVELVITNRQQIVTGIVTNAKGEPVLDASVTFFPQNPDEWTGPTRRVGAGRPDQNGRYSVRTLPPGEYFAVASEALDTSRRGSDPRQFYQDLSRLATPFTLTEGETRVIDLKVVVQP
jgi:protocatechuate 3,4-dioxygenase beta subunit